MIWNHTAPYHKSHLRGQWIRKQSPRQPAGQQCLSFLSILTGSHVHAEREGETEGSDVNMRDADSTSAASGPSEPAAAAPLPPSPQAAVPGLSPLSEAAAEPDDERPAHINLEIQVCRPLLATHCDPSRCCGALGQGMVSCSGTRHYWTALSPEPVGPSLLPAAVPSQRRISLNCAVHVLRHCVSIECTGTTLRNCSGTWYRLTQAAQQPGEAQPGSDDEAADDCDVEEGMSKAEKVGFSCLTCSRLLFAGSLYLHIGLCMQFTLPRQSLTGMSGSHRSPSWSRRAAGSSCAVARWPPWTAASA